MKCPKCQYQMKRQKIRDNIYTYVCPKCHYQIKPISDDTQNSVSSDAMAEKIEKE